MEVSSGMASPILCLVVFTVHSRPLTHYDATMGDGPQMTQISRMKAGGHVHCICGHLRNPRFPFPPEKPFLHSLSP